MKSRTQKTVTRVEFSGHRVRIYRKWMMLVGGQPSPYIERGDHTYEHISPSSAGRLMMVMGTDLAEFSPDVIAYDQESGFEFGWEMD